MQILKRLKLETAPDHRDIDGLVPLMSEGFTLARYTSYLARLQGFHHVVEAALSGWVDHWPAELEFEKRRKGPRLAEDLRALGAGSTSGFAPELPLPDLNHAWGCLYVLEGSTLGGAVISRHLARTLRITPSTGGSYLWAYGEETGPMWRGFQSCLSGFSLTGNEAAIIEGAKKTFRSLASWLRGSAA